MELKTLFPFKFNGFRKKAEQKNNESAKLKNNINPIEQHIKINGSVYIFGLQWEISFVSEQRNSEIQQQKKLGNQYHVVSTYEDSIGYLRQLPNGEKKCYSAALHIAYKHSQGGVEVFCFKLERDLYALIVLNDSRPVPGHDLISTKNNIMQLESNVVTLHSNQTMRYVGNSELFDMEEPAEIESIFEFPDQTARIKKILNLKAIYLSVATALLMVACIYGADQYFTAQKELADAELQAQLNNPNTVYEKNIDAALSQISPSGRQQIDVWLQTIGKIPLKVAGWRLLSIKCTVTECTAYWQREYGNFKELFESLTVPFANTTENLETSKELNSTATTIHQLPGNPNKKKLTRDELPAAKQVLRMFSSQLQDLSLLDKTNIALEKPKLFPESAQGTLETLNHPVIRGNWTFKHELWSLDSLNLYPFVVPESIDIQFANAKQSASSYELKGSFYAVYK
jgi:hypothetical protein